MAHELHITDGVANFFEVGPARSAWHREGHLLPTAPTLDQAIDVAELGYEVERVQTFREILTPDGPVYVQSRAFITRRTDTGVELGVVSANYVPVQNRDAFRAIEPLLDAGVLTLETGGVLRKGADAWLLGRFDLTRFGPVCREVFADEVVPYALVAANHAGRRGILLALTPIRVVCANTLGAAEDRTTQGTDQSITVAHTGAAHAKVVAAAERLFAAIVERHEVIARHYRLLKATILSEAEFKALVLDVLAPDPRAHAQWMPDARMAESVIARCERKRDEVTRLWTAGAGHSGEPTAWFAYNASVEAVDHRPDLFPTRSGVYRSASLLDGTLKSLKHRVLENLLAFAER